MKALIILASSSVYRKALLARLNITPLCIAPDINETPWLEETAEQTAQRLAFEKAQASFAKYIEQKDPSANQIIIIGSDQVLLHKGKKLGKSGSHEKAVQQLKSLSGEKVTFFTALTMLYYDKNQDIHKPCLIYEACDQSHVQYRNLDEIIINAYLTQEPAYDCAGSTKSESLGLALIQSIDNQDPSALIGLPLIKVCDGLEAFGYCVLRQIINH